jgi:hypothetical protein
MPGLKIKLREQFTGYPFEFSGLDRSYSHLRQEPETATQIAAGENLRQRRLEAFVRVLYRFERTTITFLSRLGFFEDSPTSRINGVNSKQKGYMARLGRFELPTSGSGEHPPYWTGYENFVLYYTRQRLTTIRICTVCSRFERI